jgi:hypothetical protein
LQQGFSFSGPSWSISVELWINALLFFVMLQRCYGAVVLAAIGETHFLIQCAFHLTSDGAAMFQKGLTFGAFVVASLLVATLTARLIEWPIYRWLSRRNFSWL